MRFGARDGEFEIAGPKGGGKWVGAVKICDGRATLAIRTYVTPDLF